MKRMLLMLLTLTLMLPVAMAEESDAEILTLDELRLWVDGYKARALTAQPLNDPHAEASQTEDGYQFVYEFATLYMDSPELT